MDDPVNINIVMDFHLHYYYSLVRDFAVPELWEGGGRLCLIHNSQ